MSQYSDRSSVKETQMANNYLKESLRSLAIVGMQTENLQSPSHSFSGWEAKGDNTGEGCSLLVGVGINLEASPKATHRTTL